MPPRKRADAAPERPARTKDLCAECGGTELDPTATSFGCEHGSWTFPAVEMAEQSDDAFLEALSEGEPQ